MIFRILSRANPPVLGSHDEVNGDDQGPKKEMITKVAESGKEGILKSPYVEVRPVGPATPGPNEIGEELSIQAPHATHGDITNGIQEVDAESTFPEGGTTAWLVVLSAVLLLFPSFGFMVSIGTLEEYWSTHQLADYTLRDVGWIPSVFVYLSLALGILVGPLFDRYGPRWIALLGSVGYVAMVLLLGECSEFWQLMLCCGLLGGVTGATLTTTSLAVVAHWFRRRRGLVQGIAMMGSSCGGLTIPLILHSTLPRYGYKWSLRILAFIFLGCLVVGNVLMKPRLRPQYLIDRDAKQRGLPAAKRRRLLDFSIFADLRFSLLTVSVFGMETVLFGTLGILPVYASVAGKGYPASTKFYLMSTLNGVSCLGRVLPGYAADRWGRFNTLLVSMVLTLILMVAVWLPFGTTSLSALYAFTALFGFGSGSWMALTPPCIGQLCRADEFGRYYGTLYFLASLSTLVCVPISGQLVQQVGPQSLVGFYIAVLGLSVVTFAASRAACLGWKWDLRAKI